MGNNRKSSFSKIAGCWQFILTINGLVSRWPVQISWKFVQFWLWLVAKRMPSVQIFRQRMTDTDQLWFQWKVIVIKVDQRRCVRFTYSNFLHRISFAEFIKILSSRLLEYKKALNFESIPGVSPECQRGFSHYLDALQRFELWALKSKFWSKVKKEARELGRVFESSIEWKDIAILARINLVFNSLWECSE